MGCARDDASEEGHRTGDRPYRGLEEREIKAVPPERVADLLAGEGAGYALAAELNHYPGPAHVLELGDRLELTAEQADAMRRLESQVHARARPLGRRIVALERRLDRAFRSAGATRAAVAALTAQIGALEGRLRSVHLAGHLEAKRLLSRHQIRRYDELRGYGADHAHAG